MTIRVKTFAGVPNAGDVAGPYLLSRVSGRTVTPVPLMEIAEHEHYMTIGSTLRRADHNTIVWGSGLIRPDVAPMEPPRHIIGVRGHLTCRRLSELGLGAPPVIGDPGLLLPYLYQPRPGPRHAIGLVPHYVDEEVPFCQEVRDRGGLIISPRLPLETYLDHMASCDCILSSSLHGVVFAHAYGIPAIWVTLSDGVIGKGFKFRDYASYFGGGYEGLAEWDFGQSFAANVARANCPTLPADLPDSLDLLKQDLSARGYL